MNKISIILILFISISCSSNSYDENERLNMAAKKLKLMGVPAERIYHLNKKIISKDSLDTVWRLFKSFDDTLELIKKELIATAGGISSNSEYLNLPGLKYVEKYFYGKTRFRDNGQEFFFRSFNKFNRDISEINSGFAFEKSFNSGLSALKKHYGLESRKMLFKGLTLIEAINLLESIRNKVAIEQTAYLLRVKKSR